MHALYPPINRTPKPLDILVILVKDGTGKTYQTCPNGAIGCVYWAQTGDRPDFGSDAGTLPATEIFNPLELVPRPGVPSVISGRDAVTYRSEDVAIELAPDELLRLMAADLKPDEYFRVRDRVGVFFEIHDDFYDEETGEALQPKRFGPPADTVTLGDDEFSVHEVENTTILIRRP